MTPLVWGSIFGGLAAVMLAVGIPHLLTHKFMRDPYDTSEGRTICGPSAGGSGAAAALSPRSQLDVKAPLGPDERA